MKIALCGVHARLDMMVDGGLHERVAVLLPQRAQRACQARVAPGLAARQNRV
jgi:hypothetical protein